MKKLLLTLILLLPLLCSAQSLIKSPLFGGYRYFDAQTKQYVSEKDYIKKYTEAGFVKLVEDAVVSGDLDKGAAVWLLEYHKLRSDVLTPGAVVNKEDANITDYLKHPNKSTISKSAIKLKPINLVVGASVVGLSATVYMFGNASMNDKIRKNAKEITSKSEERIRLQSSSKPDKITIEALTTEINDLTKKNEKIDKNKSTIGYICAGTSIAGIITILTGLHREHGIQVANNTYINSTSQGLSASIVF